MNKHIPGYCSYNFYVKVEKQQGVILNRSLLINLLSLFHEYKIMENEIKNFADIAQSQEESEKYFIKLKKYEALIASVRLIIENEIAHLARDCVLEVWDSNYISPLNVHAENLRVAIPEFGSWGVVAIMN